MPFSTLRDPIDLARASSALEKAWSEVQFGVEADSYDSERIRLAFIVANLAVVSLDEEELARRAIERFQHNV